MEETGIDIEVGEGFLYFFQYRKVSRLSWSKRNTNQNYARFYMQGQKEELPGRLMKLGI